MMIADVFVHCLRCVGGEEAVNALEHAQVTAKALEDVRVKCVGICHQFRALFAFRLDDLTILLVRVQVHVKVLEHEKFSVDSAKLASWRKKLKIN
jgi:hypothetical protein